MKDSNEGQGVFWPCEKARPIRAGLCVASGMFVPDTSPTINCFIQLECVSFLTVKMVFVQRRSKGVKGWGDDVVVTVT